MDHGKDRLGVFPQGAGTEGVNLANALAAVGQGDTSIGVEPSLKNHPRNLGRELAQ